MAQPNLDEEREWIGDWWLPEKPDVIVPGILRYEPDTGLHLQLIGGFEDESVARLPPGLLMLPAGPTRWSMVHGRAESTLITLRDVHHRKTSGYTFGISRPASQLLAPTVALIGIHQAVDAQFGEVTVSIERLHNWASADGLSTKWKFDEKNSGPTGEASVEILPQANQETIVGDLSVRLVYPHSLPQPKTSPRAVSGEIRQWATLTFEFAQATSFEDALDYAASARDLATLSTMTRCGVIWMRLLAADPTDTDPYPTRRGKGAVEAYYHSTVLPGPDNTDKRMEPLFTLSDVEFGTFMATWLNRKELEAPRRMLLTPLGAVGPGYVEPETLAAVSAAEVLHRSLHAEPGIPQDTFDEIKAMLLDAVPPEHKEWLNGRLSSNQPGLARRLRELAESIDIEVLAVVVPSTKDWVSKATSSRNTIAHGGGSRGSDTFESLIALTIVTRAIIALVLLTEYGIATDRLKSLVDSHDYFRKAAEAAKRL